MAVTAARTALALASWRATTFSMPSFCIISNAHSRAKTSVIAGV